MTKLGPLLAEGMLKELRQAAQERDQERANAEAPLEEKYFFQYSLTFPSLSEQRYRYDTLRREGFSESLAKCLQIAEVEFLNQRLMIDYARLVRREIGEEVDSPFYEIQERLFKDAEPSNH